MQYTVGQKLVWFRDNNHDPAEQVSVVELRSRGHAKISNGWVIDSDGVAEGTNRIPGGYVLEKFEVEK